MTGEHGIVADVFRDHRLSQTVAANQNKVASGVKKIKRQRAFDDITFDLGGPGPVEVNQMRFQLLRRRLESLDSADAQTPLQWRKS